MIDWNKPIEVVCDGGSTVHEAVLLDGKFNVSNKLLYLVKFRAEPGNDDTMLFRENGTSLFCMGISVRNVRVKHKKWINVYHRAANMHPSKKEADKAANEAARIACIPIEYYEGEGL